MYGFQRRQGQFEPRMIFQEHPLMGHSSFELTDFNRDGKPDFVVTSGDNGEYPLAPEALPRHPRVPEPWRAEI